MKDLLSILSKAVTAFVMMVVVGCAQGARNTPSGSTGPTTSPGTSGEQLTTAERTSASSFVRMPVYAYGNTDVLECLQGATVGGGDLYMEKVRSEADLVEHARRTGSPYHGRRHGMVADDFRGDLFRGVGDGRPVVSGQLRAHYDRGVLIVVGEIDPYPAPSSARLDRNLHLYLAVRPHNTAERHASRCPN